MQLLQVLLLLLRLLFLLLLLLLLLLLYRREVLHVAPRRDAFLRSAQPGTQRDVLPLDVRKLRPCCRQFRLQLRYLILKVLDCVLLARTETLLGLPVAGLAKAWTVSSAAARILFAACC